MKKILTIAGSDCSGGAGIQADIKTISAHKMYAMSAVTALTAQNTTGVFAVQESTPEFLKQQLDSIFTDIFPDAVKVGMVSAAPLIRIIAASLQQYRPVNTVVDPVMISTSGSRLLNEDAMDALITELLPLATLITPNLPEAETLLGEKIHTKKDMELAASALAGQVRTSVLLKGGHLADTADDLLYDYQKKALIWFPAGRVENPNTHGTGCTLSSAIACNLADGQTPEESVAHAKDYVLGALKDGLNLGKGSGPLNHLYQL